MIALGKTGDPMAVGWCDQDDFTNWTAGVGSTADERRLLHGSKLVGGQRTKGEILIWTDTALYSLRYTGAGDYVFDLDRVGEECGLYGINTAADRNGIVYWMGNDNFYFYNGRVIEMDCTVLRTVFDDIDLTQAAKFFAVTISQWSEVIFFYAKASGAGEIDSYAKVNTKEGTWDIGTFDRTAWFDKGPWNYPLAISAAGRLYEQENGRNADGGLLGDFIETGEFDLGDGEQIMFNRRFIADLKLKGSNTVDVTIKTRNYTNKDTPQIVKGPYTISTATKFTSARFRGRHATMRLASSSAEADWRLGDFRFDIQPDGGQ